MTRSDARDGPIYIAGLDRSGKTTMRGYLASLERVAIPPVGSNMWTYFYRAFGDLASPESLDACMKAMMEYKHVRHLQPDEERIRIGFAQGPPTYAHLFSLFLQQYAEREGKPRWGAQTGLAERFADDMFAAYPGLRMIHMVRDPRDRYHASISKWPKGRGRAGGAIARWNYSTGLAERHMRRHPDGYLVVRFEDLVTDTEATLRRVCAFIGEAFEPSILGVRASESARGRSQGQEGVAAGRPVASLDSEYIGLHARGTVSEHELAYMELAAGRRMQRWGYSVPATRRAVRSDPRFWLKTVPDQTVRRLSWRGTEAAHDLLPSVFPRKPGARMIVGPDWTPNR